MPHTGRLARSLTLALGLLGGQQAPASAAPAQVNAEPKVDLYPRANEFREVLDLSGLWDFLNHKGVFTCEREPKMAVHSLRQRWAGKWAGGLAPGLPRS